MTAFANELHFQEYLYDFAVDGGAMGAKILSSKAGKASLPLGAIVLSVWSKVVTAFTSGGAATVEWGNSTDPDGYSGAAIAVASLVDNGVRNGQENDSALLFDTTGDFDKYYGVLVANDANMSLTVNTAALTAGKLVLGVMYHMPTAV